MQDICSVWHENVKAPTRTAGVNDVPYAWDSSRDYNAATGLDRIQEARLAINSAADERISPETSVMERKLKRVKGGKLLLIPVSPGTNGHGTTAMAMFWKAELKALLESVPKRGM